MKTRKLISLVIFIFTSLSSGVIYSQNGPINQRYDIVMTPFWDFYSLNYQSVVNAGKGYTGIASSGDIMSTALNPASLQLDKTIFLSCVVHTKGVIIKDCNFVIPTKL